MAYFTSIYLSELPHQVKSVFMYLHEKEDNSVEC